MDRTIKHSNTRQTKPGERTYKPKQRIVTQDRQLTSTQVKACETQNKIKQCNLTQKHTTRGIAQQDKHLDQNKRLYWRIEKNKAV